MSISKLCADHLRNVLVAPDGKKMKATHAREIIAAFFGYKSHAAHLADSHYALSNIEDAQVMVPDVERIANRIQRLNNLPSNLPDAYDIAKILAEHLEQQGWFAGKVWLYKSIENYVLEVYLPDHDYEVSEQLSGVMAETNAYFDEAYFEEAHVTRHASGMTINVSGTYSGSSDPDKMFAGDSIDMTTTITLQRVAGQTCFFAEELSVGGSVNDDWRDPDTA